MKMLLDDCIYIFLKNFKANKVISLYLKNEELVFF